MALITYHASHEQFAPSRLVKLAIMAEAAGFEAIHSSDHFHPWSERQGQSGFSFSWLGAAMQATKLPFSVICAPGQRYHPAIVAQAIATLAEMFPGRINLELGSGEAINEMITGKPWPSKPLRNERLLECAKIIRRLLKGEQVTYHGHVDVKQARLYTLPSTIPSIFCASLSRETSAWAGSWADGLITTGGDIKSTQEKIDDFRKNGGEGKPVIIQLSFSYAATEDEAIDGAHHQWRTNMIDPEQLANVSAVEQFDEIAANIPREEVKRKIKIITDMSELMRWIKSFDEMGAARISLHNVNNNPEFFVQQYAAYNKK